LREFSSKIGTSTLGCVQLLYLTSTTAMTYHYSGLAGSILMSLIALSRLQGTFLPITANRIGWGIPRIML